MSMHELTRDEVQDRLVDLLHGRLSGAELDAVKRAIAADSGLAAELLLLRSVHGVMRGVPPVDVAAIVSALPVPHSAAPVGVIDDLAVRRAARQRSNMPRLVRAAAVLAALGGGSIVALSRLRLADTPEAVTAVGIDSADRASAGMQLSLGTSVDELSIEQLDALRADILMLDGLPSAELDASTDLLDGEGA